MLLFLFFSEISFAHNTFRRFSRPVVVTCTPKTKMSIGEESNRSKAGRTLEGKVGV